jgi:PIN domain nuclease of toxin-antitoxin system
VKLLLDTHLLLWSAGYPEKLSKKAAEWIDAKENELFFSSANIWKVVIKRALGREDFKVDPRVLRRGLFDNGYSELPIASEHVVAIENLPLIHKDPFDRVLIAQAQVEGITLLTVDPKIAEYSGPITLV